MRVSEWYLRYMCAVCTYRTCTSCRLFRSREKERPGWLNLIMFGSVCLSAPYWLLRRIHALPMTQRAQQKRPKALRKGKAKAKAKTDQCHHEQRKMSQHRLLNSHCNGINDKVTLGATMALKLSSHHQQQLAPPLLQIHIMTRKQQYQQHQQQAQRLALPQAQ